MLHSNISGNTRTDNLVYAYHAVAYLDLLGQQALFNNIHGIPTSPEDIAKLKSALKGSIGYISAFRSGFINFFDKFQSTRPIPKHLPRQFHDLMKQTQQTKIHLQNYSDSVIVWSPMLITDEACTITAINSLWGILAATSGMVRLSLASKHPVRGGIEIDGATPMLLNPSEIYGPALNGAYRLESKTADWPRIVVGPGLIQFLDSLQDETRHSLARQYCRQMALECAKFITLDTDGQPIIHYLGEISRQLHSDTPENTFPKECTACRQFINESIEKFNNDKKLGPRYLRLKEYFDRYT